jgi:hypothetical protein
MSSELGREIPLAYAEHVKLSDLPLQASNPANLPKTFRDRATICTAAMTGIAEAFEGDMFSDDFSDEEDVDAAGMIWYTVEILIENAATTRGLRLKSLMNFVGDDAGIPTPTWKVVKDEKRVNVAGKKNHPVFKVDAGKMKLVTRIFSGGMSTAPWLDLIQVSRSSSHARSERGWQQDDATASALHWLQVCAAIWCGSESLLIHRQDRLLGRRRDPLRPARPCWSRYHPPHPTTISMAREPASGYARGSRGRVQRAMYVLVVLAVAVGVGVGRVASRESRVGANVFKGVGLPSGSSARRTVMRIRNGRTSETASSSQKELVGPCPSAVCLLSVGLTAHDTLHDVNYVACAVIAAT